jgi:hypothetical protein
MVVDIIIGIFGAIKAAFEIATVLRQDVKLVSDKENEPILAPKAQSQKKQATIVLEPLPVVPKVSVLSKIPESAPGRFNRM